MIARCVCVCSCVRVCLRVCVFACVRASVHTGIKLYVVVRACTNVAYVWIHASRWSDHDMTQTEEAHRRPQLINMCRDCSCSSCQAVVPRKLDILVYLRCKRQKCRVTTTTTTIHGGTQVSEFTTKRTRKRTQA